MALGGRELRRLARQPAVLAILFLQPVMFTVLLDAVFGEVIVLPEGVGSYVTFLAPALAVFAVSQTGLPSAVGLCEDLDSGILDRLRASGAGVLAPLLARVLADVVRSAVTVAAVLGVAVPLGLQLAGPAAAIGVLAGGIVIGTAFSWLWLALALRVRSPDAVQPIGTMLTFVLLFLSASLSPVDSFPGWLQPLVRANPLTTFSAAMRDLSAGDPSTSAVGTAVVMAAGGWLVLGTLTLSWWHRLGRV